MEMIATNALTEAEIRELFFPSKGTDARKRLRRNRRHNRKLSRGLRDYAVRTTRLPRPPSLYDFIVGREFAVDAGW